MKVLAAKTALLITRAWCVSAYVIIDQVAETCSTATHSFDLKPSQKSLKSQQPGQVFLPPLHALGFSL